MPTVDDEDKNLGYSWTKCKCPTYACHCKNWMTLLWRDGFGQIGYKNWDPNETQVEQSEKVLQAIINNFDFEIS